MTKQDQALARLRAELIVEVHSGRISAQEAAQRLGVSRKTYYKWEKRALQGMVEALGKRASGRPAPRIDSEKEALREEKEELERRLKVVEETLTLHRRLFPLHPLKVAKPSGTEKKE